MKLEERAIKTNQITIQIDHIIIITIDEKYNINQSIAITQILRTCQNAENYQITQLTVTPQILGDLSTAGQSPSDVARKLSSVARDMAPDACTASRPNGSQRITCQTNQNAAITE